MRKRIVMNDHKKYYQILMEFKKTLGVDDEEFAELIRMEPDRLKDCVDTCQKPLIGTFASTASGLFRALDSEREDVSDTSADALHSLYSQLIGEYVRLNPDQFEPGLNSYLAKSLEDLVNRTGSQELTETVRQLLGLVESEEKEQEEISESEPAVSERGADDRAVPETGSALPDNADSFSEDSDMMFAQVKEAWSRLTPSGRRIVWSLVREMSVLKELQR